jgi:hypothetical protein
MFYVDVNTYNILQGDRVSSCGGGGLTFLTGFLVLTLGGRLLTEGCLSCIEEVLVSLGILLEGFLVTIGTSAIERDVPFLCVLA